MKKKLIFVFVLFGLCVVSQAQDTVRYGDPWYAFTPLPDGKIYANITLPSFGSTDPRRGYFGFKDQDYTIYGIAVTMDSMPGPELGFYVALLRGIRYHQNPYHPRLIILDSVYGEDSIKTWEDPLIKRCKFKYYLDYDSVTGTFSRSMLSNCYELYFDTPISKESLNALGMDLADTFFVGADGINYENTTPRMFCTNVLQLNSSTPVSVQFEMQYPWTSNMAVDYDAPGHPGAPGWCHRCSRVWGGVFPIIGRRCTAPRGLTLEADSSSVHWSSDTDAELFQLSICNHMWTDPDDGTIFTTTSTTQALPTMNPDTNYYIYLRKQCAFRQDSVWSDWSEPLRVGARPPAGIPEVDNPRLALEVSPNPTDGTVTVRHQAVEGTLSVADLQGRVLLTVPATQCTLDLGTLPPSTYILTLTTPSGTASQSIIKN